MLSSRETPFPDNAVCRQCITRPCRRLFAHNPYPGKMLFLHRREFQSWPCYQPDFSVSEEVKEESALTDNLEVVTGTIEVTHPRWKPMEDASEAGEKQEAPFLGDKVKLLVDIKNYPEGAPITFDIYDCTATPSFRIDTVKGINEAGTAIVEWVVTDPQVQGADLKLEFEASARSKYSTRCEIPWQSKCARRARLTGMLFDANKCFLLPQALGGIKTILGMHKEKPEAEVLIVGHAGGDEDLAGADIAFDRAQILGAYLKSKPSIWLNWFGPDKKKRSRWGTREIQLMLSALPAGGAPFYEGFAAGITDEKTTTAITAFQEYMNSENNAALSTDGKADFETRKALVEEYMGIADTTLGEDVIPIAHGCEGHFEDTATASGVQSDSRRLEVFFFPKGIEPRPETKISAQGSARYPAWLKMVEETKDFEHHGMHVQIIDNEKQPAPFAEVTLSGPTSGHVTADEHGYVSFFGLKAGEYTFSSEKNGYKIGVSKITYPTAKTVTGYAATKMREAVT